MTFLPSKGLWEQDEATMTLAITCHKACLSPPHPYPTTVTVESTCRGTLNKNTPHAPDMSFSSHGNTVLFLTAEAEPHP